MEIQLGELYLKKGESVDPSKYPNETFEYYSIPAYDSSKPEIVTGQEIGSSKKIFKPNDIILSRIVPHIRRCWVVNADKGLRQIGSGEWITFRSKLIEPSYLRHYLMSNEFHSKFLKTVKGVGGSLMRADPKQVARFKIFLPSLPVQKRIAEILDLADAYRQKTKALLEKYDELAQSIFLDMFGDPVTNPKGWEKRSISEISHITTKGESPKWQGFEYIDQGVRFITSENVRMGYLNVDMDKFVHPNFHLKLKRSQLKENDLLVNLVGASIGRGALVNDEILPANINQAVAKTELDSKKVHPKFVLEQIINPRVQAKLIGNRVEGARANISLKNVRELSLIVPPISFQTKFVQQIHSIEMQKEQVQTGLRSTEDLFNSLLQKAFKGELVKAEELEAVKEEINHG